MSNYALETELLKACFRRFIQENKVLEGWYETDTASLLVAIERVNVALDEWNACFELSNPYLPITNENDAYLKFDSDEDQVKFILAWS